MNNWTTSFPMGYTPRDIQRKAIQFALQSWKTCKYVILQAPTGTGKSHIALTLANYFNSINPRNKSYILTTQLILQDQYKREFPACANISARGNYQCKVLSEYSCADMKWTHKYSSYPSCQDCVYQIAKHRFITNYASITNTAFFLSNLQYNQPLIQDRYLLIVDECHNLQQQIIRFKGIDLNYKVLHHEYGFEKGNWINTQSMSIMSWIKSVLVPWIQKRKQYYTSVLQNSSLNFANSKTIDLSKKYDYLDKLLCQINRMLGVYNTNHWISYKSDENNVVVKPIFASDFTQQMMFRKAEKILLMSGTILNKQIYCKNLGIPVQDCAFISLDSPFAVQSRPIFFLKSGSMSKKNIDQSLPTVISDIKKILEFHEGEKGIIHVSSHKLANLIVDNINSSRLVIVEDFKNRNDMLQYHYQSSDDCVLISPSLMEGVDLKDDLSRFQIIAKIPFPNLGDKYIFVKKSVIDYWYSYQTAKVIVQSYGRSIRHQDDYAITYILDSDFQWFLKFNKHMFPKYFLEALTYGQL